MPIARLTNTWGQDCTLATDAFVMSAPGIHETYEGDMQGVVDTEGVLWALERSYNEDGTPAVQIPGPKTSTDPSGPPLSVPRTLVASPNSVRGWTGHSQYAETRDVYTEAWWLNQPSASRLEYAEGTWFVDTILSLGQIRGGWRQGSSHDQHQVMPLQIAALVGTYHFPIFSELPPAHEFGTLTIASDGTLTVSVDYYDWWDGSYHYTGHIKVQDAEHGIVEFRLTSPAWLSHRSYFGRGWMADADYGRELVLVGHPDGGKGFGLVAIKQP